MAGDMLMHRIRAHRSAPDIYDPPTFEAMAERIEELEAKLEKAMELANLVVEFSDRALWKVVKEVVLELKGEK